MQLSYMLRYFCKVFFVLQAEVSFMNWHLFLTSIFFQVYVLTDSGSNLKLRMSMLKDWHVNGGVMILGYEMYRNLTQFKRIKNKRHKKIITETLLDPGKCCLRLC